MTSRQYQQRLRADAAEQTRRRILDAVYERLRTAPTTPVSIDQIARAAGVARSTVYLVFGSRAGLFDAVGVDLLQLGGFEELMHAATDPDARKALRGTIRAGVRMYAKNRDVLRVLHSMALLDPEAFGEAVEKLERGRARGMEQLARELSSQGMLRTGIGVKRAADLLWLLTSFDSFDQLHTDRTLSMDRTANLLTTAAERALCEEAP